MVKTRLQKRIEKMEELTNFQQGEIKENERLKRKKEMLEQTNCNIYTITGTIEEIEMELKRIKREKEEKKQKLKKIINQIVITWKKFLNFKKNIRQLQQLTYMEDDINFYYWYSKQMFIFPIKRKNASDSIIIEPILKSVKKLPDELINYIQEYLPYETKCSLLEHKYDPIRIINKFKPSHINEMIHKIFYNASLLSSLDYETKENINVKFNTFYDCRFPQEQRIMKAKRNITDQRLFLKNIILSLKPKFPNIMYDLFKIIIIVHKNLFTN